MLETKHDPIHLRLLADMARTRLDLAGVDLQAHLAASLAALGLAFAAIVLALSCLVLAGVVVIAVFWETHRVIATVSTAGVFAGVALSLAAASRSRWRSRPDPFAGVWREIELDRAALRRLRP